MKMVQAPSLHTNRKKKRNLSLCNEREKKNCHFFVVLCVEHNGTRRQFSCIYENGVEMSFFVFPPMSMPIYSNQMRLDCRMWLCVLCVHTQASSAFLLPYQQQPHTHTLDFASNHLLWPFYATTLVMWPAQKKNGFLSLLQAHTHNIITIILCIV